MIKKPTVLVVILSVAIILVVAATDFFIVYPINAGGRDDLKEVFGNFKFWDREDSSYESATGLSGTDGFLRSDGSAESYESLIQYEEAVILAVERSARSVVSIVASKDVPVMERCQIYDPLFGPDLRFYVPCDSGETETVEIGSGTGFFVTSDGLILTNNHVVSDKNAEYSVFSGDDIYENVKVIALDEEADLALLKVEGVGFPVLALGNSDSIRLGQTAIAIGNALGEYKDSVSVGVISGLSRSITAEDDEGNTETLEDVIQTDAAINLGNSGGPLVNLRGEVIGINTALAYDAENIGFAIPINKARGIIEPLIFSLSEPSSVD
jgi:S1-C subfamily serine protease